ncbi:phosphoglycerate mutase [Pseudoxanthomonas kalamensis DSM 18571]|uniref:phosphoglycerate mutase n=1 Tax=Pseudoxanthomonas kalamensis TaxID=289483 RepID=UPI001390F4A8|nr:phosphoglycerate mutase [Pseudoxanthomonas kalamensis]KAF1709861.1 phosphoglycerate mutase [Pseudoxanthomonas kalamensis DSM 18571]
MPSATLLLAERPRLGRQTLPDAFGRALARADREQGESGETAQLRRHFRLLPDHWPVAALTRQLDAGDAAGACWLRADPVHIAPDIDGARMLAHGEALQLQAEDLAELLPALRPLFGDAGFALDAPSPSRWYLRLPEGARLPTFAAPEEALGDDLYAHLPPGDAGRRWRALLSETQVILHNHPWNRQRAARGQAAVNSLWFWGAGLLPDSVAASATRVQSADPLLRALGRAAGLDEREDGEGNVLIDLRHLRSLQALVDQVVLPLLEELKRGRLNVMQLDFADGAQFRLRRGQRWRFWRRGMRALDA